jgi:GntR family transcriptional regulator
LGLEKPTKTPRYVDIAAELRQRIDAGEWAPGEPFMGHRKLMQEYGIAGTTASAVRRILLAEGVLVPVRGVRMVVRRPPSRRGILRTTPSPESAAVPLRVQEADTGRIGEWASQTQSLTVGSDLAALLQLRGGDRVMETKYQFLSAGKIVRLATAWEPYAVVDGTPIMLPEEGLFAGHPVEERMAAIGISPLTVRDELVACPATLEEGQLLGVGVGSPVLKATRTYSAPDGRPVHVEQSTVRGDTTSMVYTLSTP